ncbi:MAG: threonylcarbamoyl-AMP synthase [Spirochaetes bacterium]|nr:threonylcarbamoyl-AMP synthase [Spirochaetota bacterium]
MLINLQNLINYTVMIRHIRWLKNETNMKMIARKIRQGESIVMPTDTVYGILTSCFSAKGIKKIYRMKKRETNKPFLVLVPDLKSVKDLVVPGEYKAKKDFLKKAFKNPVTVILKAKRHLPGAVLKDKKVAIRIPGDKVLKALLRKSGVPLVAPSANRSGGKILRFPWQIIREFKNSSDHIFWKYMIWDIRPSTIIDLSGEGIKYIRIGRGKVG